GIPAVFVTGIGGGVSNIGEALETNNFWAVVAEVRLDLVFAELLKGKFEGEFSSSYVKLTGEMTLKNDDDGKVLKVDGGLNIQWKPNGQFNFYGNATLLSGLLKGGISIKIEKDYFYAYVYATLMIPEDIPIIGGLELSGMEAAGSVDFIGANLKIIGIKFGFIYYWGDRFEFGKGIDLSGRGGAVIASDASYFDEEGKYVHCTAMYGTNLRRLQSSKVNSGRAGGVVVVKNFDPTSEDALLFEIPFDGYTIPSASDIIILTPSGKQLDIVNNDGEGGGNFLVNDRGENNGKYIYVSVTDTELLEAGDWTVSINTDGVTVNDFAVNGVDNLPELTDVSYSYSSENPYMLDVRYFMDGESNIPGALDVYITENPNAAEALRQSVSSPEAGLISLGRITLDEMKNGSTSIRIPDTLANGEYTVLCMLSQDAGGMSLAVAENTFTFTNKKLPENVKGVSVTYGGDGDMRIEIERDRDVSYNEYQIMILDENMQLLGDTVAYRDERSVGYRESAPLSPREIFMKHGSLGGWFSSVYQLMYLADKTDHLEKAAHFMHLPDYLNYRLSGVVAHELSIAQTSMLIDPKKCEFDEDRNFCFS
ncbi:MAG: hypothetical protein IIW14_09545, partial [Kiritimatiellae bacterium]|nr:hypothetical protein [Kiritimatiellia bacterium]